MPGRGRPPQPPEKVAALRAALESGLHVKLAAQAADMPFRPAERLARKWRQAGAVLGRDALTRQQTAEARAVLLSGKPTAKAARYYMLRACGGYRPTGADPAERLLALMHLLAPGHATVVPAALRRRRQTSLEWLAEQVALLTADGVTQRAKAERVQDGQ